MPAGALDFLAGPKGELAHVGFCLSGGPNGRAEPLGRGIFCRAPKTKRPMEPPIAPRVLAFLGRTRLKDRNHGKKRRARGFSRAPFCHFSIFLETYLSGASGVIFPPSAGQVAE